MADLQDSDSSSGTLSSDGGDEDENEDFEQITFQQRESILGGKLRESRRLSTTSSAFYSHYSENPWMNDDGLQTNFIDDNKSVDDSDEDGEQLDAEQLLEHEHEKLQFFDESLNQCNKLSLKMTGVLQNLQDKLRKLQTTLDPIRKDTTQVASAEKNINRTMSELRKVMEYHKLTTEPLDEIRKKALKASSGLNPNTDGQNGADVKEFNDDEWDDPFLNWIEKINEARDYFQKNQFRSSEAAISNLKNIAKIALKRMEDYFHDLLKQHTNRNKNCIGQIINYKLQDMWKERDSSYPLWTNKLLNRKHRNKYKNKYQYVNNEQDNNVTDLLYIPYNVIKLLANVAVRIDQTANVHKLPDNLSKLVIAPRSNLLLDILNSLNDEQLLNIMYIHAYYEQAMKNKTNKLFNKPGGAAPVGLLGNGMGVRGSMSLPDDDDDDDDDDENKEIKDDLEDVDDDNDNNNQEEKPIIGDGADMNGKGKHVGVLSADALDKLNTMNALENNPDDEMIAIAVNIDIKKISHPVVLFLHIGLSLFQLERYLCSTILDVKNEVLLEFDEFFNEVIAAPLRLIIQKIEKVLKVKDQLDVDRIAQSKNGKSAGRRVSFNQMSNLTNSNIPIEEAAKLTAKSTAEAAIKNDSIHRNMILVKLDLVATWMKLYPQFDKVLNQSQDYGIDDDDENKSADSPRQNGNKDDTSYLSSKRGMVHLSKLGDKLYLNCYETLENRIRMIKSHKETKSVIINGGYHPLTIETINLMYGIYEFRDALQHLYDAQKSVSPMVKILLNNEDDGKNIMQKQQIEKTLVKIVSALKHNLRDKSRQYGNNKKTLESIFMLNNLHYIVKKISNTDLELACGQEVIQSLRKDINKRKSAYEHATWDKVKGYLDINKVTFTTKTKDLNTKEKQPIKKRYAGFNKEFKDQLDTQKYFSVPDNNLRTELINKNIDIIMPLYRKFVSKFKNIEFTKDRGKYHKYDEKTLHEKMHQFFQQN